MHGTGVLSVTSALWVVSDTHTSRAMSFEKYSCHLFVNLGWCKGSQKFGTLYYSCPPFKIN